MVDYITKVYLNQERFIVFIFPDCIIITQTLE